MGRSFALFILLELVVVGLGYAQRAGRPLFTGDFRLRYEYTSEGNGVPATGKEVVRLRAGIIYPLNDWITFRARAATGAPGDPNSTDITLGEFVDDLAVSLDIASLELSGSQWSAFGGKFANPFLSTELVWDGDVNPAGVGGRLTLGSPKGVTGSLTALYFIIDQLSGQPGSNMGGGQLGVSAPAGDKWRLTAAGAFYDFRIRSLAHADAGDIRSNRLAPGGTAYLWDFDLIDVLVALDYRGLGARLPLRVMGNYVKNLAVEDGQETALEADLYLGQSQRRGDVRGRYGYALAETDAVLAAFAHDNTTLASNSETHTLALDVVPADHLLLNATWYLYRPHESLPGVKREYQGRLRLNATVAF
jgi:putative porin